MYCRSSNAHCPGALRQCVEGVPKLAALMLRGCVWQDFRCLLPLDSATLGCTGFNCPLPTARTKIYCRNSTTHCPKVLRQCVEGAPLPRPLKQCNGVWWEFNSPLPPGNAAVHCKSSIAHFP